MDTKEAQTGFTFVSFVVTQRCYGDRKIAFYSENRTLTKRFRRYLNG